MTKCYEALKNGSKSIRLLILCPQPHPEDNRVRCTLIVKDLDSSPEYEALSYTWGVPDNFGFKIWVNDVHLPVRRNLLTVLRALRRDEDRILWIDALCINQDDVNERNQQVAIMGSIYVKASQVLGWLGTPDPHELNHASLDIADKPPRQITVAAFRLLEEASTVSADVPMTDSGWDFSQWVKWNDEFVNLSRRAASWKQLADLCRADYWTRMWIAQEICLAPRLLLLYGTDSVAWDTFVKMRSDLRSWVVPGYITRATRPKVDYSNLHIVRKSRPAQLADYTDSKTKSRMKYELKSLMELSAPCFSSERHDKIYGILGLGESELAGDLRIPSGSIPINYSQSLFSLYESVMREYEKKHKESALLVGFSELLNKALVGPFYERSALTEMRRDRDLAMASRDSSELNTLDITGKFLGRILKVSSLQAYSNKEVDAITTICQSHDHSAKIIEDSESSGRRGKGYSLKDWTKILGSIWEEDGATLHPLLYAGADDSFKGPESPTSQIMEEHPLGLKTFFATNGLIGVAPRGVEEGDLIWKVDWTNTIAVIRPRNGQHAVVGKALIANGVLKKEAVKETTTSFYDLAKENFRYAASFFLSHDLGKPNMNHQTDGLIWPQPKFGVFKYETPPEDEVSIDISMPVLQALTSPLRWQEKDLKGNSL